MRILLMGAIALFVSTITLLAIVPGATLRAKANALVLRATQAALTACKGVGFVHPHPAQRWARQALFFLVWSCPRPAAEATLDILFGECAV